VPADTKTMESHQNPWHRISEQVIGKSIVILQERQFTQRLFTYFHVSRFVTWFCEYVFNNPSMVWSRGVFKRKCWFHQKDESPRCYELEYEGVYLCGCFCNWSKPQKSWCLIKYKIWFIVYEAWYSLRLKHRWMESSFKLLLKLCHSLFCHILISISAPNSPVTAPMTIHHVFPNTHSRL